MTFLEMLNKFNAGELTNANIERIRVAGQIYTGTDGILNKEILNSEAELLDKFNNVIGEC